LILFIFFTFSAFGQEIYLRNKGESIEAFINRSFPETNDNIVHEIIEGKWGDTTSAQKIVVFYKDGDLDEIEKKAIVLQLISGYRYKRLEFTYSFGIGAAPNTSAIESVFFYDSNENGLKELIVIGLGVFRCYTDYVEYNEETKRNDTLETIVSCDLCEYTIFEYNVESGNIEVSDQHDDFEGNCNVNTIKGILEDKKKK
jgi:hypothetical protein